MHGCRWQKLAFWLSLMLVGCGESSTSKLPTGEVSGTVTFEEKPLSEGQIVFQHESGNISSGKITTSGKYTAEVTVGKNVVSIQSREPERPNPDPNGMPKMLGGQSRIPEKYTTFTSSGLNVTVGEFETTYNVKLIK